METQTLGDRGVKGVQKASEQRQENVNVHVGLMVHKDCRRDWISEKNIKACVAKKSSNKKEGEASCKRTLRSDVPSQFSPQTNCFLCGREQIIDSKTKKLDVRRVLTNSWTESIRIKCHSRNDDWSTEVLGRLNIYPDCFAADAVYHQKCSVSFRNGKPKPLCYREPSSKRIKVGRHVDDVKREAFEAALKYLEANKEPTITVKELVKIMQEQLLGDEEAYSVRYMKACLLERYGTDVVIAEIDGKEDVVALKASATKIIQDFHRDGRDEDDDMEKRRLIKTAANLILSDIREVSSNVGMTYPSLSELESLESHLDFLPFSLKYFLNLICTSADTIKVAAIGQSIMQVSRPRSLIAPLQIGLGVQLHYQYAKRFLVDTLNHLGFCSSYTEVQRFEKNAALHSSFELPISDDTEKPFVQYVADNVDHNIQTLDGTGTFHGMGIISAMTPANLDTRSIPRGSPSLQDITNVSRISIHPFIGPLNMGDIKYKENKEMVLSELDEFDNIDFLWKVCRPLSHKVPTFSAFMQCILKSVHPGVSSITFLPMIDLNPSDPTCIYSTLHYVQAQSVRHNCVPILTFDQPLYWKAQCILQTEPLGSPLCSIVLRLGAFHAMMSFLACIGHLMTGSGLHEVLETVYASNTVAHIIGGKAISRAMRAHSLVQSALYSIILENMCALESPESPDPAASTSSKTSTDNKDEDLKGSLLRVVENLLDGKSEVECVYQDQHIASMKEKIKVAVEQYKGYRTSELWLQYDHMVDILFKFIKAERTGNFTLHLGCLRQMLPYLAASGHNNYTKSILIYVQQMEELQLKDPSIFQTLSTHHTIRRSDRFWAGLSTDLVIEQVLMRSIKTSGGLTRGKGFTESQRSIWCQSMPYCAAVNRAMQSITDLVYVSSEQHKEAGSTRRNRDAKDIETITLFLKERSPFIEVPSLRNIVTGEVAGQQVNVDRAKVIGQTILRSMCGVTAQTWSFKKSMTAKTLSSRAVFTIESETIHIDQQLLFQRLILISERKSSCDVSHLFSHELCIFPPALFDSRGLMLPAQKSALADHLWDNYMATGENVHQTLPTVVKFVIDGGALLHRLTWQRGVTYKEIISMYGSYLKKKYSSAIVVFDGYQGGPSTKDTAHRRRKGGMSAPTIIFDENTTLSTRKELFLSNDDNKHNFIVLLGRYLAREGHCVFHADGDADNLIVSKAIESAQTMPTALVGDDTDLLCLLIFHAEKETNPIYFAPTPKQNSKKAPRLWDIKHLQNKLGQQLCRNILFLHAFSGCDTTSRIYGFGKKQVLKLLQSSEFQSIANTFYMSSGKKEIFAAGEKAMCLLYQPSQSTAEGLNQLRCTKFAQKAATSTTYVYACSIPPTAAAARQHSLRVYLQLQTWIGRSETLNPKDWGWEMINNMYQPIYTDQLPAPADLLKVIRCACKGDCSTFRCTCRKNGLECSTACADCKGSCTNITVIADPDEQEAEGISLDIGGDDELY